MPWPSRRRLGWLALLAVTAGFAVPAGAADPPCRRQGALTERADGWTQIRNPAFSTDGGTVEAFAVVDGDPAPLLATNGLTVARSADAGCTWREVFHTTADGPVATGLDVEAGPVDLRSSVLPRITHLETSRLGSRAFAVTRISSVDGVVSLPELGLLVSDDGGETWDAGGQGLPRYGDPVAIRTSLLGTATYLLVREAHSTTSHALYLSADGGASWALRSSGDDLRLGGFEVDPVTPNLLWAWSDGRLLRSVDAGATFAPVPQVAGRVGTVDVRRTTADTPGRVSAFTNDPDLRHASADGGRTWAVTEAPGSVRAAASSLLADLTVVSADTGVHLLLPNAPARDLTPRRVSLEDVWVSATPSPRIYGWTRSAMYRLDLDRRLRPVVRARPKPRAGDTVARIDQPKLRITRSDLVGEEEVVLEAGETRTVPYRLDMAPNPTPLDVYFMTDSTGSMKDLINGVRADMQEVVDELAQTGVDAWFGVADFKDYPAPTGPTDYPYRRLRALGPPDDGLAAALNDLDTGGGSGHNSALAALREAATGPGQRRLDGGEACDVPDPAPAFCYYVEPGQDAGWRPGALHVVVLAADVEFSKPSGTYPGPSFDEAIAALNDVGARHVGFAVGETERDAAKPRPDMERVSDGTGALAPPGGIDCDEDGEVDVEEGQPLVCALVFDGRDTRIAPALLSMLDGVEDRQDVDLRLTGDRERARLAVAGFERVDVKDANRFTVPVTLSCPRAEEPSQYAFGLAASVRDRRVAGTSLLLTCRPRPVPPAIPPAAIPPIALAVVPPPPPPPAPVPQVNPQPNPNPNPQANPQPNVGIAAEEQEHPQLALAEADEPVGHELAMSARSRAAPEPALPLAAAVLTALAGAAAARTSHRIRTATGTRRRRT